jgi:hypothetical protein
MDDTPVTLWTMRRENAAISCQVRLAPHGIEVDMLNGRTVVATRVFETDAEAMAWAHGRRELRLSQGWEVEPTEPLASDTRIV